jgi:SAM-dependent methyltransferase
MPDVPPDRLELRRRTAKLARETIAAGDATGWFETLYREADGNPANIPWADQSPNPHLLAWLKGQTTLAVSQKRCLVVGCGLGDDAEYLANKGFSVVAFDVSATAVEWCKRRFPGSKVAYLTADLFKLPQEFERAFDFVVEIYTVQALPLELRERALRCVASCVGPGGVLLLVCRARELEEPLETVPWPIAREELFPLEQAGLQLKSFEDFTDSTDPPARRFRAVYVRPISSPAT